MCDSRMAPSRDRNEQVAGFLERAGARVDEHARARDERGRHLALVGRHAPTAAMCVPVSDVARRRPPASATPSPARSMSAPRTASRSRCVSRAPAESGVRLVSAANSSRCTALGLQTRTSLSVRTWRIASRWLRACTPEPMIASTRASGRARCLHRDGRDRGGPRLGDVPAVHQRDERAVWRVEQQRCVARCDGRPRS